MFSTATSNTATGTVASAVTSSSSVSTATSASQFETFLKMLTTQIKNQDPLNPMEGTEFAVQLATFSGVEQQVQTNVLLGQLLQGASGGELGQLSGWIGREVRTSVPVWYDGTSLTLKIDEIAQADRVELVTLDGQGKVVSREDIGSGAGEVDWQGKRADGTPLPAGLYSFRIEAQQDGKVGATRNVEAYTKVTGVEVTPLGPKLILAGGASASVQDISALRE